MIEINLLPEERRKRISRFKKIDLSTLNLQDIPVLKVAYAVIGAVILIQIALFFIGLYSSSHYKALEKRYNDILPRKKEADELKLQAEAITRKVVAIDELMINRFDWAEKLNELSNAMIPGIWLTELYYEEKISERQVLPDAKMLKNKAKLEISKPIIEKTLVKYLILSGYALNTGNEGTAVIGKFIKTLKSSSDFYSDFSDIELGGIKREKMEDQEVMSFKITCLFKERVAAPKK